MKSIILYESKTGCTKKMAEYIKNKNETNDLCKVSSYKNSLQEYEHVVLLSPIYMGSIHKKIKLFLENNKKDLLNKDVTFVVCGMNKKEYDEMLDRNFDQELRNHINFIYGGGAYYLDKLNFFYRFIIKKMAKVTESLEDIKYANLDKIKI